MNAVTKATAGTAMALLQGLKKNIANVQQTLVKKGGEPFLRLLKDGSWVYGQEDVEVEEGSAWAVNPMSIMHGYSCWRRGEGADNSGGPLGEAMVPASMPLPDLASLPDFTKEGGRWDQTFSFSLKCMTGEDRGEQVLYKTNSVGGIAAVDKLLTEIGLQIDSDPTKLVPVVILDSESYNHKKHGKTYTPIIAVKDWLPFSDDLPDIASDLEDEAGDAPEPQPEPAKATRQRKAAAKPAEPANDPANDPADEDETLAALIDEIARRKAAKDAETAPAPVDEKAARRAALEAQLAELNGGAEATTSATPAGQPQRRRRA